MGISSAGNCLPNYRNGRIKYKPTKFCGFFYNKFPDFSYNHIVLTKNKKMKKFGILLFIALIAAVFTANISAQTTTEKITANITDLTLEQCAKLEAANAQIEDQQQKLDTCGKWVGVGGEIGTAVKEGLSAVVDVADKFGSTDVGKFTMTLIAWKVMGKDVIRIILGLLFIFVVTVIIFKSHRSFTRRKMLVKSNGWKF